MLRSVFNQTALANFKLKPAPACTPQVEGVECLLDISILCCIIISIRVKATNRVLDRGIFSDESYLHTCQKK